MSITSYCQVNDNFDDGDFTSTPEWIDTAGTFIVNSDLMLQLNAEEGGESFIYTLTSLADSIRWQSSVLMDFAPSASNTLKIYLAADNIDPSVGNSLFFEIGESGSNDALNLYENNSGILNLIASATMGALGSDPAEFVFLLEKTTDNLWSLYVDYGQTGQQLEWEMMMDIDWLDQSILYGFSMEYTSTRVDKYFFDNVVVEPLLPDSEAPSLISVNLVSPTLIDLVFSEPMDLATLQDLNNYNVSPSIGAPSSINVDAENTSTASLNFTGNPLQSGLQYEFTANNLTDIAGNVINTNSKLLQLIELARPGDIYINEILFNPTTGGFDFVEIYNASDKLIDLSSLEIANVQKDEYKAIDSDRTFFPQTYLAICPDIEWLMENYTLLAPDQVIENSIPSFNDSDGNVSIFGRQITGVRIMVDSLDYDEDWHFILLDDDEGISLEKVSPELPSTQASSWQSASENAGFATPGYENSQIIGDIDRSTSFALQEKTFSPNQDGDNDRLLINYNLDKPGYVATINIYNDRGFLVTELYNNELLSTEGLLAWDGTKNDTQLASIGIYILTYELWHPDGDTLKGKLGCVLADFLK